MRWDFENNGEFDSEWGVEKTATHVYDTIGDYTIKLEVKDKYGIVAEGTGNITVVEFPIPTDGLVAYWSFSGDANDESGNENDGTVNGATLTTDRFGNANSAYDFNNEHYISLNDSNFPSGSEARTISTWIKADAFPNAYNTIFSYGTPSNGNACGLTVTSTGSVRFFGWNTAFDLSATVAISTEEMYHLVGTYDGTTAKLYINGVLNNSALMSWSTILNVAYIGRQVFENNQFFYGQIDDIRIYNRALTETEVQELYQENGWSGN